MCMVFVASVAAFAEEPYVSALSVSDATPTPGASITLQAGGLAPNRETQVLFDEQPIATTTSDANGVVSDQVTIPVDASDGEHLISVARAAAATPKTDDAPAILLSASVQVQRGGAALSSPDGNGITGYVVAVSIAALAALVLILGRRRSDPA